MNETIQDRIMQLCEKFYEGNFNKASIAWAMSPNTVRALCGKIQRCEKLQDPKLTQIVKVMESTGVSAEWLIRGIGTMFSTESHREVHDNYYLQVGGYDNMQNIEGTHTHAHKDKEMTHAEENECKRLRAQNYDLSRNLSSVIAQNHSLINTNQRLTDHILQLKNGGLQ